MATPRPPSRQEALASRLPHDPDTEAVQAKYAGNGTFAISPEYWLGILLDEVRAGATKDARRDIWQQPRIRDLLWSLKQSGHAEYLHALSAAKQDGVWELEQVVEEHGRRHALPPALAIQASTDLMTKAFPAPVFFIQDILLHGLTLFAGKKKRGKSVACLNMALAIACGHKAFRALDVMPAKVLYISLEDDEELLQLRLTKIQPNFTGNPNLHFTYSFPRFADGALEAFKAAIDTGFTVIFLDVLGRVLPKGQRIRQSYDEYALMTDILGPLQTLANESHAAIIILDHVRKAEADDPFDTIIGSSGKWGVADHGMIYQRRFKEKDAIILTSSRRLGDNTLRVTETPDGYLQFLGMGEEYEGSYEEARIIKTLDEERRPLTIRDVMHAIGIPQSDYPRLRVTMHRLYNQGAVGKTKRGLYTVGVRAHHVEDEEEVPF